MTLTTPARWLRGHCGRPALPPPEPMTRPRDGAVSRARRADRFSALRCAYESNPGTHSPAAAASLADRFDVSKRIVVVDEGDVVIVAAHGPVAAEAVAGVDQVVAVAAV